MLSRPTSQIKTLGQLKAAGYRPRSIKQEIRDNLRIRLKNGGPLFPGILGYDRTVIPSVINALIMSRPASESIAENAWRTSVASCGRPASASARW